MKLRVAAPRSKMSTEEVIFRRYARTTWKSRSLHKVKQDNGLWRYNDPFIDTMWHGMVIAHRILSQAV